MKKLLVYSHDTFGLGNIRRMLAICHHLLDSIPELSILLVTGSPVIHSLRLPEKMDYIKLPCLTRVGRGEYTTKYLSDSADDAVQLRSDLIQTTVTRYKPDLILVDKKPMGVKGELAATLNYLHAHHPETKLVLVLRDILDKSDAIVSNWERNGHYDAIVKFYEEVLILGDRKIFDPIQEYRFPASVEGKTIFCGYVEKLPAAQTSEATRNYLEINENEKLVLVTTGGGQDGYDILKCYLEGIPELQLHRKIRSLVICGPEMPEAQKLMLQNLAAENPQVIFYEFSSDILELMAASDVIITMGGYNTVCEIISLQKSAIVIPRKHPTEEQLIRAEHMSQLGFFEMIDPEHLTSELLMTKLAARLETPVENYPTVNLNALPNVTRQVERLLNLDDK